MTQIYRPTKLSNLKIDADKNWGGYDITNLGSRGLTIGDAIIEGESAGLREEHGEIFNDEVGTTTSASGTVSFATAFSSKPFYIVSGGCDIPWMREDQGRSATDDEDPVTTSDLDWIAKNQSSNNVIDIWVEWLALGS